MLLVKELKSDSFYRSTQHASLHRERMESGFVNPIRFTLIHVGEFAVETN